VEAGKQTSLEAATEGNLDRLTIPLIVNAATEGDDVSLAALHETGQWLGIGIANLINALNPQRVVFGGILSLAHQFLLPVIHEVVENRAWTWSSKNCEIVVADYGTDACLMGGVATVYREVLSELRNWT
jgi:predicted NBD/HSP70 family sugar kinase